MNPSYSFLFIIIFYLFEFKEFLSLPGALDSEFLGGVREGRTGIFHMSFLAASKAKSLFETLFSFFWSKFLDFYYINIHSIGVFGHHSRGRGEGLEGLGGPSTSLNDLFCTIPLVLKVDGLEVPVIDLVWYRVKRYDPLHEWGRDSCSKKADQDIVVRDAGVGGIALEDGDVTFQ